MQFSNLFTLLSLALTASAAVIQRTSPSCSNTQSLMCCNTITQQVTGGKVENVGVQCNPVNGMSSVLPWPWTETSLRQSMWNYANDHAVANVQPGLSGQCIGTQQLACCNTGGVNQVSPL